MRKTVPPWRRPAAACARGGGSGIGAFGKPLETMGLQSYGATAEETSAMLAGLRFSKPRETVGLQSHGG